MINRIRLILPTTILCLGFSFTAHAEEANEVEITSASGNSVVILVCQYSGDPDSKTMTTLFQTPEDDLEVTIIDPPDFSAVNIQIDDNCSVAVAKMNHYGWHTQFWGFEPEVLIYVLKK